ncbi:MAG: hypothetical protein SCH98_09305 [Deferrisomatales bacterium]|nr:hypothetical protein [Deferrisomatales bacterium]
MTTLWKAMVLGVGILLAVGTASQGEQTSKEQLKGLDEQIQEIKGDVLAIASELNLLEEKLLYPSETQITVFVALAGGDSFRLDSVDLRLGGSEVAHHLYTYREQEALRMGGVQRLFTGNVRTGSHQLQVSFHGKSKGGDEFRRTDSHQVEKGVGPKIVKVTLDRQAITFEDR